MSAEKIAAIKAKRLAKKRTTIKVDDELDAGVLVSQVTRRFFSFLDILTHRFHRRRNGRGHL
jgi:hypothetical protein